MELTFSRSTSAFPPCDNLGMAATVEEGTAPKLVTGKCVAWVGETIVQQNRATGKYTQPL